MVIVSGDVTRCLVALRVEEPGREAVVVDDVAVGPSVKYKIQDDVQVCVQDGAHVPSYSSRLAAGTPSAQREAKLELSKQQVSLVRYPMTSKMMS